MLIALGAGDDVMTRLKLTYKKSRGKILQDYERYEDFQKKSHPPNPQPIPSWIQKPASNFRLHVCFYVFVCCGRIRTKIYIAGSRLANYVINCPIFFRGGFRLILHKSI